MVKLLEYKTIEINPKRNRVEMMFTRKDGTYSSTDLIKYPFKIINHELRIKCRFYDLRGSFAIISLRNRCEIKDIAEVLGHKRIETTQKYYITSTKFNKNEVVKYFEYSLNYNINYSNYNVNNIPNAFTLKNYDYLSFVKLKKM